MYCYNCGIKLDEKVNFCSSCGFSQKKSKERRSEKKEEKTFVKRTKAEVDDLGEIVKSSKVVQNVVSSKDSAYYLKKKANLFFVNLFRFFGILSIIALLGQLLIVPIEGEKYWMIKYLNDFTDPVSLGYITGGYVFPMILIYAGFRDIKVHELNTNLGLTLVITFLFVTLGFVVF